MNDIFSYKRILVVTAHPDDEAFLAAGSIRKLADAGAMVAIVCATRGERGCAWTELSGDVLALVRERELRAAAALMGADRAEILGFADGSLAAHEAALAAALRTTYETTTPELVVTFGADGYTGHTDHCALHRAATAVALQYGTALAYFSYPPEPWRTEVDGVLARKRVYGTYESSIPVCGTACTVGVDPEHKLSVLQVHETQFPGLDPNRLFSAACAEHFLSHEYFTFPEIT